MNGLNVCGVVGDGVYHLSVCSNSQSYATMEELNIEDGHNIRTGLRDNL